MNLKFWRKKDKGDTKTKKKKSAAREWFDAILFAVIAATLIRGLFIEAYTIPTGSMEKSLLIGDFLFVSKVNYGPRMPMTPVAFPFAHHTMPLLGTKAYWDGIQWKYRRLPGLSKIKRGDVVVFNYPMDADSPFYRPVDKRENYIKRCQAIPGDTMRIINAKVYVNGKLNDLPGGSQKNYMVESDGTSFNPQTLMEMNIEVQPLAANQYVFNMTAAQANEIKGWAGVKQVQAVVWPVNQQAPGIFPQNPNLKWNLDNMGPIIVPKQGWTVTLDSLTIPIYKRAIEVYEGNKVQQQGNELLINGKKATTYTFKLNYYWMMGDNRDRSEDSRYWGFVPEDHIVGKALFVWMSWDTNASFFSKVRWSRIFMGIK